VRDVVAGDVLPGSPGAPCALATECTRNGATCCLASTHVCWCGTGTGGGTCNPAFCP
jgi:hypothetical protein